MGQQGPEQAGHLGYYTARGISPVRYDTRDLGAHFDRRDSVYRALGLPPVAFKGCDVLEVAPGSGQNSLYVAQRLPKSYDLVEANPTGVRDIQALYSGIGFPHTAPRLHAMRFEAFAPDRPYDIVICENWLGSLPNERALIRKLAGLVAPGGVLVLTIVPYSGFAPNVLRKLLALRVLDANAGFEQQTALLVDLFGPHLATMKSMTRSHKDWVHDCLLNPHYLNVALPLDIVLAEIGDAMEVLSSAPTFRTDWRWFKSLAGTDRDFNAQFQRNYLENIHNFVDHRRVFAPRSADENATIERLSRDLHAAALAWQEGHAGGADTEPLRKRVRNAAEGLARAFADVAPEIASGFEEAAALLGQPVLAPSQIKEMKHFAGLFGRETVYMSFTKRTGPVAS